MVVRNVANVEVVGSNPISRSECEYIKMVYPLTQLNSAEDLSLPAVNAYRTVMEEETPNTVAGRRR